MIGLGIRLKTTKEHSKYWRERKIDWNQHYTSTWNHPHRDFVMDKLKTLKWMSVVEVGCASGPNLIKIANTFPKADIGGIDINPDAITTAQKIFKDGKRNAWFKVGTGEDIMMSDNSTDIVLSDMCLIYVGPTKIRKYLQEMYRVARKNVVLLEFYSPNILTRLAKRLKTGYNVYDYRKLLEDAGFYDITIEKLPPELWGNHEPQKSLAYLITGKK